MNSGQEIGGRLLVATGNGAKAFNVMKEALDVPTETVQSARLASPVVLSRGVHGNDGLHGSSTNGVDDRVGVVPCVGDQSVAGGVLDQALRFRRVVLLAGREDDVKWLACGRRDRMDLGGKTSSRTAQSIASDPPFPPAASWCARTTVPSMSEPTSSSTRNALKAPSQTPRFAQRAKRLYVVFQGPYLSGKIGRAHV